MKRSHNDPTRKTNQVKNCNLLARLAKGETLTSIAKEFNTDITLVSNTAKKLIRIRIRNNGLNIDWSQWQKQLQKNPELFGVKIS